MIINISAKNRLFQYCYGTVIVQSLSHVQLLATPWTIAHQVSLSFTISRSCSNSCPLSQWCYLTISSSVAPFSSCPRSFPASGSFPMSRLFASGGQSIVTVQSMRITCDLNTLGSMTPQKKHKVHVLVLQWKGIWTWASCLTSLRIICRTVIILTPNSPLRFEE